MPAHYFPNIILFKIFNRINLNFGVAFVAVDLKLFRKNKIKLPITILFFLQAKNVLIFFGPMATAQKLKKIKIPNFRHFTEIYIEAKFICQQNLCENLFAACRPPET